MNLYKKLIKEINCNGVDWHTYTPITVNYELLEANSLKCSVDECECDIAYDITVDENTKLEWNEIMTINDFCLLYEKTECGEKVGKRPIRKSSYSIVLNPDGYNTTKDDRTVNLSVYDGNEHIISTNYLQGNVGKSIWFTFSGESLRYTIHVNNSYSNYSATTSPNRIEMSTYIESSSGSMYAIFKNCSNLLTVDFSNIDASKFDSLESTFYNCSSLTSINVSNFDSNVKVYQSTFYNCNSLKTLYVKQGTYDFWYSKLPTDIQNKVTIIEV